MSWAETMKINNNVKKALNEQMREARFLPLRIITATGTFTPEKTGIYKVICVGAGGDGEATTNAGVASGGGGGVAIKTLRLLSTTTYNVTVSSSTASFAYDSTALTATSGDDGHTSDGGGVGGTASGGDFNYPGVAGKRVTTASNVPLAGSVGVVISELTEKKHIFTPVSTSVFELPYGDSILGYGGGGTGVRFDSKAGTTDGLPAAVIIIPLEMEA